MRAILIASLALLAACTTPVPDVAPPPARRAPAHAAAPTTRLVLPTARDRDCADFTDRAAAQAALRSSDPDRLDADRDGIACEKLR